MIQNGRKVVVIRRQELLGGRGKWGDHFGMEIGNREPNWREVPPVSVQGVCWLVALIDGL